MKLHLVSFGCQMNAADSAEMARPLLKEGFQLTHEAEEADVILINTCTVRQHAEDRAFSLVGRLREWKRKDPNRFLIVTGCAAERTKENLKKRFPHVDLIAGAKSIDQFPEMLEEALRSRFDWKGENRDSWPPEAAGEPEGEPSTHPVSDFVTIMRGCNYTCTYCIVPAVRGREIYRPSGTILQEVREKLALGTKEIVLLGQTVNSYRCGDADFAKLLRAVDRVPGVERIRFMSPHPHYLTEGMMGAMAECAHVCEHLHLPVQSGSNRILKQMRRNYTRESYLKSLESLRKKIPDVAITTDIIVGFPSETEEDFRQTLSLLEEARFDSAFCFKFSSREGTEAAQRTNPVDSVLKEERLEMVLKQVQKQSEQSAESLVGSIQEVLVEDPAFGRTRSNHRVQWKKKEKPGSLVRLRMEARRHSTLLGLQSPIGRELAHR